tara:strand:+ start:34195 stop:34551 length:357 start_codon:yes stop_codon:yes gene_type:complete
MRYVDVGDDYVNQILAANKLANGSDSLTEATKAKRREEEEDKQQEQQQMGEATDLHECPLCESQLDNPLSVEQIQEHIEFILETINEAEEFEGEELSEAEEEEDDAEEDEDEEDNKND